jgi:choline kinase
VSGLRAVILAAGSGSRLRPVIGPYPKCLAAVGDRTLLERQLDSLRAHGIDAITVVVGYRREAIEPVCGRDVHFVYNADYATTNSLYSLWLARDLLSEGFVVLNSDVLFHPHLLTRLLASSHDDALLMARREIGTRYSDEEMKVHVQNGCVAAIDKALDDELAEIRRRRRRGAASPRAATDCCRRSARMAASGVSCVQPAAPPARDRDGRLSVD